MCEAEKEALVAGGELAEGRMAMDGVREVMGRGQRLCGLE